VNTNKKLSSKALATIILLNIVVTLSLVLIADRVLDASLSNTPTIFAPNSSARYKTVEFDAVANINKFGFRGDETDLKKGQVIVVGDSFTFGFGLSNDSVWPRLLENSLSEKSKETDVYNLGSPGSNTAYHVDIAMNYVDALQPSVVVLSVLLGDDFQQVHEARLKHEESSSYLSKLVSPVKSVIKSKLIALLPGSYKLYHFFKYKKHATAALEEEPNVVTSGWSIEAADLISERGLELPASVKKNALSGNINPGLLVLGDEFPNRSWSFWKDVTQSDSEALLTLDKLDEKIGRLNTTVELHGGKLFLLSMPSGGFVRSQFTESYRDYGANIPEESLESLLPELILKDIAHKNGVQFIPTLEVFREYTELYPNEPVFFPIDGHLTPFGGQVIASIVSKHLE
jgi:hypothetical protein